MDEADQIFLLWKFKLQKLSNINVIVVIKAQKCHPVIVEQQWAHCL